MGANRVTSRSQAALDRFHNRMKPRRIAIEFRESRLKIDGFEVGLALA
jgi:hypothetical protein